MRKIMLIAAALLGVIAAKAQDKRDTVVMKADTVVISSGSKGSVRVTDKGRALLDFDIPFYNKLKNNSEAAIGAFGIGSIFTDSKAPLDFNPQNSLEFYIYALDSHTKGHSTFSFGPGVTFRNFALTGDKTMSLTTDGDLLIRSFPEGSVPKISKLRVFSVNLPLLYSFSFGDGFGFTVGPVFNLNTSSSIVNKYRVDGDKQKDKFKRAHCNLATVEGLFQINLKYLSLYVKYSPMSVMDKKYCPEFTTWTFGISPF